MRAVGLNDVNGFERRERLFENARISEKPVEFGKNEFGNRHILLFLNGSQPRIGRDLFERRRSRISDEVIWASALIWA